LLPETDCNPAVEIADRLRLATEQNQLNINEEISFTISIGGVSIIPDQETSFETLFDESDIALYRAKEKGKNRVEFYR